MSLAGSPKELIENPDRPEAGRPPGDDVLSDVLRKVRVTGSLQFCFMPTGAWQTDDKPSLARLAGEASNVVPFHIVAEGSCWLKMNGTEAALTEGDVVAFPFGTGHQLGSGRDGRLIIPTGDLPPKPWSEVPVLRYGEAESRVRLLCGYLYCDALSFRPLKDALPPLLHAKTYGSGELDWLGVAVRQIIAEADEPRTGGLSTLERLSEIILIELLRQQIAAARTGAVGWLAALSDPALAKCLSLIHDDPKRDWSVQELAAAAGLSRSTLAERFEAILDTSPMRYVRDWRLYLASVALSTATKGIAAIAYDAGYGTEAAFNRAFSRAYGVPPAAWRQNARQGQAEGGQAG